MKAILYENGIEIKRVNNYAKQVNREMQYPELSEGLEWKFIYEHPRPAQSHLYNITSLEQDNNAQHPDYPDFKMIEVVYTAVKKSDAEIIELLKAQEDNANRNLVDKIKYLALYMGIVNRKVDGGNITPKMQTLLDDVDTRLVKLWQNDTNLDNKLTELSQGGDPDITDGWTNE